MSSKYILLISLWVGALTGFGELGVLAVKKIFLDQFIQVSRQVIWMAPVADALLFSLVGIGLAIIAWRKPALVPPVFSLSVFSTLAYLSLLLMFPGINKVALLLLAAGLGLQTGRLLARHWVKFSGLVRRTTFPFIVILSFGALAGSFLAW